jgi:hypothetical protein
MPKSKSTVIRRSTTKYKLQHKSRPKRKLTKRSKFGSKSKPKRKPTKRPTLSSKTKKYRRLLFGTNTSMEDTGESKNNPKDLKKENDILMDDILDSIDMKEIDSSIIKNFHYDDKKEFVTSVLIYKMNNTPDNIDKILSMFEYKLGWAPKIKYLWEKDELLDVSTTVLKFKREIMVVCEYFKIGFKNQPASEELFNSFLQFSDMVTSQMARIHKASDALQKMDINDRSYDNISGDLTIIRREIHQSMQNIAEIYEKEYTKMQKFLGNDAIHQKIFTGDPKYLKDLYVKKCYQNVNDD